MEKIKKFWQKFPKIAKLEMLLLVVNMAVFRGAIWAAEQYPEYRSSLWFWTVGTGFFSYIIFQEYKIYFGQKTERSQKNEQS